MTKEEILKIKDRISASLNKRPTREERAYWFGWISGLYYYGVLTRDEYDELENYINMLIKT